MRSLFKHVITPWSKLIVNPIGYPDQPPVIACWIWSGVTTRPTPTKGTRTIIGKEDEALRFREIIRQPYPKCRFAGKLESPARVLWAYMHHLNDLKEVPLLRRSCSDPMCINPMHTLAPVPNPIDLTSAPEETFDWGPTPEPQDPRKSIFKAFFYEANANSRTTIDDPALKEAVFDPKRITLYFPQYLEFIKGKHKTQIEEDINAL